MQRTNHHEDAETVSAEFKAKVALEAIKGHETVAELASKHASSSRTSGRGTSRPTVLLPSNLPATGLDHRVLKRKQPLIRSLLRKEAPFAASGCLDASIGNTMPTRPSNYFQPANLRHLRLKRMVKRRHKPIFSQRSAQSPISRPNKRWDHNTFNYPQI